MPTNSKAVEEAEAKSLRKEKAAADGARAMAEYLTEARLTREKTERLRKARLARDAARAKKATAPQPPAEKAPALPRAVKTSAKPLVKAPAKASAKASAKNGKK